MPTATGQPAPGSRPLRADARRNIERILEAAETLVERRGADASFEEIAREAGVGSATLYRHFPSRMALMESVFRERMEKLCERAHVLASEADPKEALDVWLRAVLEYGVAAQGMVTALVVQGLEESDPDANFAWGISMLIEAGDELVSKAHGAGTIRADVTTPEIMNLVTGIMWVTDRRVYPAGEPGVLANRLLTLVLEGIRPGDNDRA